MFPLEMQIEITMSCNAVPFSMVNCLSLPILLSLFGPMAHNFFLSYLAITDTKSFPLGSPQ